MFVDLGLIGGKGLLGLVGVVFKMVSDDTAFTRSFSSKERECLTNISPEE